MTYDLTELIQNIPSYDPALLSLSLQIILISIIVFLNLDQLPDIQKQPFTTHMIPKKYRKIKSTTHPKQPNAFVVIIAMIGSCIVIYGMFKLLPFYAPSNKYASEVNKIYNKLYPNTKITFEYLGYPPDKMKNYINNHTIKTLKSSQPTSNVLETISDTDTSYSYDSKTKQLIVSHESIKKVYDNVTLNEQFADDFTKDNWSYVADNSQKNTTITISKVKNTYDLTYVGLTKINGTAAIFTKQETKTELTATVQNNFTNENAIHSDLEALQLK